MTEQTNQTQSDNEAPKTFDEGYVKELRQEAANYRTKLREAESQLEQLSSKQKELRSKEFELAAKAAGAVDPQTLLKLIDLDAEGNPDDIVKEVLESKPFLKGGSIGKPSNPASGNGQPQIYSRADLDGMSQDDIKANWDEIQSQMQRGLIR